MKKIIIAALCFASSVSFAASVAICPAAAVGNSTTDFVKTGFTPKCSANTSVYYSQNSTVFGVGAVSTKGNQRFTGHSQGGAVTSSGACTATACTAAEAGTALDAIWANVSTL